MSQISKCRLCLSEHNVTIPIFGHVHNVLQKIRDCTSVRVAEGDCLPKYICNSCLTLLELFHQFSVTAANSQIKLLQTISAATKSPSETPSENSVCCDEESFRFTEYDAESIYYPAEELQATTALYQSPYDDDSRESVSVSSSCEKYLNGCKLLATDDLTDRITDLNLRHEKGTQSETAPHEVRSNADSNAPIKIQELLHLQHENPKQPTSSSDDVTTTIDSSSNPSCTNLLQTNFNTTGLFQDPHNVLLTVIDEHHVALHLYTLKNAPLQHLLDRYCKLSGNAPNQIGLRYNGRFVKDNDTACNLGLTDGDVVHVVVLWQQSGVVVKKSEFFD